MHYSFERALDKNNLNVKYPAINDVDNKWGLVITTLGFQKVTLKEVSPKKENSKAFNLKPKTGQVLDEYQLLYFTKGRGTFASNEVKDLIIEAGMVVLLFPYDWHTYKPDLDTDWDYYWIGFKGMFADNLVNNKFLSKQNPVYNIGFSEQLVELYKNAIASAKEEKISFQQYISSLVIHMLGLIHYTNQNKLFIDKDIVIKINKAKLMMREYPTKKISPEKIANYINMSYSWFRKMFKKYTGLSPVQYQLQIKVQKAKELLTTSTLSVKAISALLQFDSVNYFISFFKEKTNESPIEFRNRVHNTPKSYSLF